VDHHAQFLKVEVAGLEQSYLARSQAVPVGN
jgi:hypothetical protein